MGLRNEIPQRAFINAQILQLALKSGFLAQPTERVCRDYGIDDYQIINPAYTAGLLYCLIVVPKESWWSSELLEKIRAHDPMSLFDAIVGLEIFDEDQVGELIRRLRNSICHADYCVSNEGVFTFRDGRKRGETPQFEARISPQALSRFLSIIGAEMANAHGQGR